MSYYLPHFQQTQHLGDSDKIQFYQYWAKNYSVQWQDLIKKYFNLTGEQLGKQLKKMLAAYLKSLQTNVNDSGNTDKKRSIKKTCITHAMHPHQKGLILLN